MSVVKLWVLTKYWFPIYTLCDFCYHMLNDKVLKKGSRSRFSKLEVHKFQSIFLEFWISGILIKSGIVFTFYGMLLCYTNTLTLMALIGTGAYGANLAKLMWTHVHTCFWMAKYWKAKSFKQPIFDWIKITDFLIAKLTVFWSHFSLPKNDQFCYKEICNFDPIQKGLLEWFWFSIFCPPKTFLNMGSHQFSQVRAICTSAY